MTGLDHAKAKLVEVNFEFHRKEKIVGGESESYLEYWIRKSDKSCLNILVRHGSYYPDEVGWNILMPFPGNSEEEKLEYLDCILAEQGLAACLQNLQDKRTNCGST